MLLSKIKRYVPNSGDTITLENSDGDMFVILAPAADIATLTLVWPPNPHDGLRVTVLATKNIAALTHSGGPFNKVISTVRASGDFVFVWDAGGSTYMSEGGDSNSALTTISLPFSAAVAGGAGNAVVYLTDTGLVTGKALFASIDYVHATFDSSDPNFGRAKPVVSNGNKTLTVACVKQAFTGITLLSTNILGSVAIAAAADGTTLSVLVHGKLAA